MSNLLAVAVALLMGWSLCQPLLAQRPSQASLQDGARYTFGESRIEGIKQIPREIVEKLFDFKAGDVVDLKKLQRAIEALKDAYGRRGYLDVDLMQETTVDDTKRTVALTIRVSEGPQYSVRLIDFSGNTKTRDNVLRREFLFDERATYNSELLRRSILRLNQLGYFEQIDSGDYDVRKNPQQAEVDILVRVRERDQQPIGVTGGVSGTSGKFVGLTYVSNNFRGRGQRVEVELLAGTRSSDFLFDFTEPYLFDTKASVGLSVFAQRVRFDTFGVLVGNFQSSLNSADRVDLFTRQAAGASVSTSYPFWDFARLGVRYSFQNIGVRDIVEGLSPAQFNPNSTSASYVKSEVTPVFQRITKNGVFNATQGSSIQLQLGLAGGLVGGDLNRVHPALEYQLFVPDCWLSGRRHTWAFRSQLEHLFAYGKTQSVPLSERIFSGGEFTIRGFDFNSITPYALSRLVVRDSDGRARVDPNTGLPETRVSIDPVGADTLVNFSAEYRIPVAGPLSVALFGDLGLASVLRRSQLGGLRQDQHIDLLESTNNRWRASTGAELQVPLPVVGLPFRLIFAYNPLRLNTRVLVDGVPVSIRDRARTATVRFTVGHTF